MTCVLSTLAAIGLILIGISVLYYIAHIVFELVVKDRE